MAVTALAMWATWAADIRNANLILFFTALTGIFSGLMIPSWQAFVPSLVPKDDLPSAITINSTQFNASRAIGPALAGVLLATAGPGLAFLLNGVSFLFVIAVLAVLRPVWAEPQRPTSDGVFAGFASALRYVRRRSGIWVGILCAILVLSLIHI